MTQREELSDDKKKLNWLLGLEKETLADMAHQQSKIIEKLQKAAKAQAVPETNKDLLQSLRDMVETAKQLIHNGYFYIDIIEEQIRHGYNVKANQARVAQYKREITMLENWINANLQIDDVSIL